MASRIELNNKFKSLIRNDNVYFQPPESIKINYPAIIYDLARNESIIADNFSYKITKCYDVTIIFKDPEFNLSQILLENFSNCTHIRRYVSDGLYHDILRLYY